MMVVKTKARLKQEKRFGLIQFVWFGFAMTTGARVFSIFAIWSNPDSPDHPVGMHALWVLVLTGFIAWGCSYAYSKLARMHRSSRNGAGYIYTRSAWGRFIGGFVGLMQYAALPIVIMVQTLFLFRGVFSTDYTGNQVFGWNEWTNHLGPFKNLWLDLCGIGVYMGASLVALLGVRYFRWFVNFNSIAAWVISGILLVSYLAAAAQAHGAGWRYWTTNVADGGGNQISFRGCLNVAVAAFFSYSGFETYSTAGRNLKDPERNTGRGINIIMLLVICFLFLGGLMCFAGFYGDKSHNGFNQLMHFTIWSRWGNAGLYLFGMIIMLTHNFLYKFQLSNENMFYGGTMLQPLAEEGYVPTKFQELNQTKGNIPIKAMKLNYVISVLVIVSFLVVPDLVDGALGDAGNEKIKAGDIWNFSSVGEVQSVVVILIYFIVVLAVFKLWRDRKLHLTVREGGIFAVVAGFLLVIFGFHYYDLTMKLVAPGGDTAKGRVLVRTAAATELCFAAALYGGGLLLLRFYYLPRLRTRLKTTPAVQQQLDKAFLVHDDWYFVCARFNRELTQYQQRNQAIHRDPHNPHYQQATKIKQELQTVADRYQDYVRS